MTTIDQMIRFRSTIPIKNHTHKEYYCILDMVLQLSRPFIVTEIRAMMEKVKDNL
jgi:hypothetical protein